MDVVDFAKSLYKHLDEREQDLTDYLSAGGASSFENYKQIVGEIQGIAYARSEIRALLENTHEDVEDTLRTRSR